MFYWETVLLYRGYADTYFSVSLVLRLWCVTQVLHTDFNFTFTFNHSFYYISHTDFEFFVALDVKFKNMLRKGSNTASVCMSLIWTGYM
jgi:hypothetical protein